MAKTSTAEPAARAERTEDGVGKALHSIERALWDIGAGQKELRRSVIAHRAHRPIRASDLLALHGANFVEACYVHLFARLPDPAGLKLHDDLLRRGQSRERMLLALHESPEARAMGARIAGIRRLSWRLKARRFLAILLGEPIVDEGDDRPRLADFLGLDPEPLVQAVYTRMLKRKPDPRGLEDYTRRLEQGAPKSRVIGDLIYSREGRLKKARLGGLWWRYVLAGLFPGPRQ